MWRSTVVPPRCPTRSGLIHSFQDDCQVGKENMYHDLRHLKADWQSELEMFSVLYVPPLRLRFGLLQATIYSKVAHMA
jgi:hypothetical protein